MKNISLNTLIIFIFLLTGCDQNTQTLIPDCGIQYEHMNNEISIIPNKNLNNYNIGDSIEFYIRLNVDTNIKASINFNSRIFQLNSSEGQWEEIQNSAHYFGNDYLLSPSNTIESFGIDPDTKDYGKKTTIYVCIYGYLDDETQQPVGASYFFTLLE